MDPLSPRQQEFQEKLVSLLGEYARAVGPEFDGNEEGLPARMPVPTRWLLICEWADVADGDNGPFVVLANGNLSWVDKLGLIHAARCMTESE